MPDKPLRIIFICNEYPPAPHGGIGVFVKIFSEELVNRGHQVAVLGYDPTQHVESKSYEYGVLVWRIKNPFQTRRKFRLGRFYISLLPVKERSYLSTKLEQLIEIFQPDFVESYDWSGPLWRKPSVPLVVRLHGANSAHQYGEGHRQSLLLRFFEKRNLRFSDALCAVSDHIASLSAKTFGLEKTNIRTLYNFVDLKRFKEDNYIPRNPHRLLYVGRLYHRKGLTELFKIMNEFFKKSPDYYLELYGQENKNYSVELLKNIEDRFKERVIFKGKVDHNRLSEIYSSATIFLMPSRAEAFGLTAIEAMACNTPVMMSNRASGPEIIKDGVTGFLFDIMNIERVFTR